MLDYKATVFQERGNGLIGAAKMKSTARVRSDIEEELAYEPGVDAAAIGVAVEDGVVTLFGHVASHAEKMAAEHAAVRVRGVKAIVSELEVKIPASSHSTGEELANLAVQALSWNTQIPADRIKVRVEHGWITLEGDVDWHYQKTAAYNAVCNLKGVRGVSDRVVIRPSTISTTVEAHIEAALRRRFGTRKNPITIETSGDHVTLRGAVNTLAERAEIERAAWTTPGVCHVNNNLSVVTQGGRHARKAVERVSR